jgi:prevent-host-death family protein
MAIDFIPLPMSELRTHPGEILDRVANGGESFVIEKNGRKKACLVPLSVFLPDISPARIAHELDELERGGESLRTTINSAKEIEILFKQKVDRNTYSLKIVLPHEYPNACPRVYADPIDADAPHRFSDGALCIFGVMSSWNPGKHSARTALLSGRQWLRHYEAWRNKGEWPKPEVSDVRSQ